MNDKKNWIIDKAKEINIDMIGFTDNRSLSSIERILLDRIEEDRHTEFEELNIDRRINPEYSFKKTKSIIVIGICYNNINNTVIKNQDYRFKGNLSKSSYGKDYHYILRERMENLVEELNKDLEFNSKIYVDTGPLVDRELAYRAGLGYYGKNSSIINKDYGSFIFIGYIMTDLEIEIEDNNIEDQCGDCDLCIKACPTSAIKSPYIVDSKRCVSYLTQTKDYIDEELRHSMGRQIYGCDICQMVCPKNKDTKICENDEFIARYKYIDLEEIFVISNREFKEKYGHMAGSWRGRNIFKRNAIIALGNIGDKSSIEILEKELLKDDDRFNDYIIWALDKINMKN